MQGGAWGIGIGINRYRVSVGEDEKVLEIGCGDGCTKYKYTKKNMKPHIKIS